MRTNGNEDALGASLLLGCADKRHETIDPFPWDAENRLVKMESRTGAPTGSKLRLEFAFDYQGRRIWKKVTSLDTGGGVLLEQKFVYDGWNLLAILNSAFSLQTSFTWGLDLSGSLQGAGGVGGLLAVNDAANGVHFCAYDGNGNVTALVKATDGTASANYEYGPFGEVVRSTGLMSKANPFRFSTKYQDDESDQLYYGYRSYNPSTGRWLSRDPIGEEGGNNVYGFVGNKTVNFADVLGKSEFNEITARHLLIEKIFDWYEQDYFLAADLLTHFVTRQGPAPYIGGEFAGRKVGSDRTIREELSGRLDMFARGLCRGRNDTASDNFDWKRIEMRFLRGEMFWAFFGARLSATGCLSVDCKSGSWTVSGKGVLNDSYTFAKYPLERRAFPVYRAAHYLEVEVQPNYKPFEVLVGFDIALSGNFKGYGK